MSRYLGILALSGLSAGCGAALTNPLCLGQDLPTEIAEFPPDLSYVAEHRMEFASADHPLSDVEVGAVLDNLAGGIDGCWGYTGVQPVSAADPTLVDVAAVLKVDLAQGVLQVQEFIGEDVRIALWDNRPALFVWDRSITDTSENQLMIESLYADAAIVQPDGTLRGDCLTGVAATISLVKPVTATLQVDALVTHEAYDAPHTRYWRRFDCVADTIELLPSAQ